MQDITTWKDENFTPITLEQPAREGQCGAANDLADRADATLVYGNVSCPAGGAEDDEVFVGMDATVHPLAEVFQKSDKENLACWPVLNEAIAESADLVDKVVMRGVHIEWPFADPTVTVGRVYKFGAATGVTFGNLLTAASTCRVATVDTSTTSDKLFTYPKGASDTLFYNQY